MGIVNREHALTYSGEDWADIKELRWSCMKLNCPECINLTDHKTITDHCKYKYLLQTEGHAYSGRLKYLLNCKSVVIADKLEWDQHFHHLLDYDPASPQQNMVLVPSPFKENLPRNAWDDLRNRYLTPAANACYWRYLVKRYAETMQFEVDLQLRELIPGQKRVGAAGTGMAAPYESFVFMGTTDGCLLDCLNR
ncbi:hypothetical protein BCR33DRAFT_712993 [Rhizoclosmatium globosum]|uniref:Glycosyl transferase CAP10 domain-containing protein n=1 Tax=Rhizoclosmatium globosum TaxID=329046 RepID=A0A1Y2CVM7_9FUNG|nr:hypothetical protein BCR33DRAFT_712993 [Rhizoclosmatium globosum]|eukprot:ORY51073.1 hypothetical protein BCR33DRAFT_712993 [Rhizoclosmatium globosum]